MCKIAGGHRALITHTETQFADKYGVVNPTTGRFIYSQHSSTFGGSKLTTNIIITWGSDQYKKVSVIFTGNHFQSAKVVATFLLASERIAAIYIRVRNSQP